MPDGTAEHAAQPRPRSAAAKLDAASLATRTAPRHRLLRGRADDRVCDLGPGGESLEGLGSQLQASQSHASTRVASAERRRQQRPRARCERWPCTKNRARCIARATPSSTWCSTSAPSTSTPTSGVVHEEGQAARPLLRVANWLHLNRGKKAWTYIADFYAVFLLFLAISGLFMIPGRKGLLGRGAIVALLGAAVPIAYVVLSGGP